MIRRPPRSPLFPYPTLSRSMEADQVRPRLGELLDLRQQHLVGHHQMHMDRLGTHLPDSRDQIGKKQQRRGEIDRKSTRLNSSHANISYAVFCLKTKIQHVLV